MVAVHYDLSKSVVTKSVYYNAILGMHMHTREDAHTNTSTHNAYGSSTYTHTHTIYACV